MDLEKGGNTLNYCGVLAVATYLPKWAAFSHARNRHGKSKAPAVIEGVL